MHLFIFRHPTSCCSAAEIMSTLFFKEMKYHVSYPRSPSNDRFVLSKVSSAIIGEMCMGCVEVCVSKNTRWTYSKYNLHFSPSLCMLRNTYWSKSSRLSLKDGMLQIEIWDPKFCKNLNYHQKLYVIANVSRMLYF